MANGTFDQADAARRHDKILADVRKIVRDLDNEVLAYYKDKYPHSEEEKDHKNQVILRYLKTASTEISNLLNGQNLYN